ncbi:ornithine decarboxylase-like [Dendronephthya gigantea]|uniref:ornithine decarboxylase-like n=1 Tax=Dendronephthya gigantea TaxID=151771 RepID=UPI001069D0F3|nr:ornithine decarboxylase-like [Dendronephthya gigantea]
MKILTNQNSKVYIFDDGVTTKEVINTLMQNDTCEDDAFYCVDIGDILKKHYKWKKLLPRIEPFYAIKCNTDPVVLELMVNLGIGFDCASKVEIQTMLSYGVKPHRIVFANPCKQLTHMRYAVANGINLMTFDNKVELQKIKAFAPNSRLLLRILTDDSKSLCQLGIKYGAALSQCKNLLEVAKELDLNVVGVSFHVGSGCFDATAFKTAVESARLVFDWAAEIGFDFSLLDVGGGFPGSASKDICFEQVCSVLNKTLDECFPVSSGVRIIAEPGRFYVSTAFTLVTNVTSIRETSLKVIDTKGNHENKTTRGFMYYINEGVYGSFNCLIFDHSTVDAKPLRDLHGNEEKYPSSIWGPSCDSMDCVTKNVMLPECGVGDWLYFEEMGAYTLSAASGFNGFLPPGCFYFISRSAKSALEEKLPALPTINVNVGKKNEQYAMPFDALSSLSYVDM